MDKEQKILSRKRVRKFLRYAIMFLVLMISTQYIPDCNVNYKTSFILAAIGAIAFCIIDMYFPILCN
jgi:hypothetical protein